jgi:hypothetical protein
MDQELARTSSRPMARLKLISTFESAFFADLAITKGFIVEDLIKRLGIFHDSSEAGESPCATAGYR